MRQSRQQLINLFRFFRLFGINPFAFGVVPSKVRVSLQKPLALTILLLLMAYWFSLGLSYFRSDNSSFKLALISNWIQMTVNALALTVILVSPMSASAAVDEIFELFEKIDARVLGMGVSWLRNCEHAKVLLCIASYVLVTIAAGTFEVFVVLVRHQLCFFFYWLLTFVPGVVTSAALCFSYCLLRLFLQRLRIVARVLDTESRNTRNFVNIMKVNDGATIEQSIRSTMPSVFYLFNDIIDLGHAIEKLLGPIFLASFTSIFVITTTQIYHTYTIIMMPANDRLGYSPWSAAVCVNIVIVNLVSTVMLTSICETIGNQSHDCMRIVMKMRLNGSRYFAPEEIQKMSTAFQFTKGQISFSAVGFFKVNYKMLCGMVSSILTYLIIYIQFFSLNANSTSTFHNKHRLLE